MVNRAGPLVDQRFVRYELVAIPLEYRAGESPPSYYVDAFVVLLQLIHQGDEIAVAADDREGINMVVSEGHLERVEGQVDVCAVLVAARRRVALNHLHRV